MSIRRTDSPSVTLTHHETGISVTIDRRKSWHEAVQRAERILKAKLFAHQRGLATNQQVKTYHTSGRGTWTKDHRLGLRVDGLFMGHEIEVIDG